MSGHWEGEELLEAADWYVIPCLNPDGYNQSWNGNVRTNSWSARRPEYRGACATAQIQGEDFLIIF